MQQNWTCSVTKCLQSYIFSLLVYWTDKTEIIIFSAKENNQSRSSNKTFVLQSRSLNIYTFLFLNSANSVHFLGNEKYFSKPVESKMLPSDGLFHDFLLSMTHNFFFFSPFSVAKHQQSSLPRGRQDVNTSEWQWMLWTLEYKTWPAALTHYTHIHILFFH